MLNQYIIEQYHLAHKDAQGSLHLLERQLIDLLKGNNLKIHSVTSRLKEFPSFKQKISRPDKTFSDLWDVTDLLGLRVITYFEDSIEEIASLIEKEFHIDLINSEDKLHFNENDRFGYRSLHYICYIPSPHHFQKNARFEIQIRTVLQHAWAEIEHDLGYKVSDEIPGTIRRRFSQVASLLEVADRDFVAIRKELKTYEQLISNLEPNLTKDLNLISLKQLVNSNEILELDTILSSQFKKSKTEEHFYPDYLLKALNASGLTCIESVLESIRTYKEKIISFASIYYQFTSKQWNLRVEDIQEFQRGYSLLFICHIVTLENKKLIFDKINSLTNFYYKIDYPKNKTLAEQVSRQLVEILAERNYFENINELK